MQQSVKSKSINDRRHLLIEKWRGLSITRQLLIAVNSLLIVVVSIALTLDYQARVNRQLAQKRIALTEEAMTLYESLLALHHSEPDAMQDLVDNVCARMNAVDSPGHHIAVEWGQETIQAMSHGQASPSIMATMRSAAGRKTDASDISQPIVIGYFSDRSGTVYISENRAAVLTVARQSLVRQVAAVFAFSLLAAIIVNVVLTKVIASPIQGLVVALKQVADGDLSAIAESKSCKELGYLAEQFNSMTLALAAVDRDRRAHMEKARQIQQHLLPKTNGLKGLRVAELFEPAEEIGGDYFDVVSLNDDRYLLCLADVTGHGVPAAMTATVLKSLVQEAVAFSASPAEIITRINRRYSEFIMPGHFATMVILMVDTRKHEVRYASAGHEPPFIQFPGGKVERLTQGGLVLGVDEEMVYAEGTIATPKGTRLVIVSDGVTEAFDPDDNQFGTQRVASAMQESCGGTIKDLVDRCAERLKQFQRNRPAFDDTTLLAVELIS